ncbi:MAG: LrgB family protein [Pseudomonas aeruginosa]|nr:LrgB family protein [Pseudomonas aeruginosa]
MAWQAALEAVIHHPLFGVGVTLGAYQLALAAYERTRWVFLQPVLVSMLVVIGVLLLCGIDYDEYSASAKVLTILLGPATVALAVPLFLNLRRIRQLFWPTLLTLVVAGTLATVLGIAFGWLFGAEPRMLMSMAPKSVTSPIAMLVASQIGALAGLGQESLQLANTGVDYLMTLPNSRANENEADLIGLELAARAGYNPEAAITLWQKMGKASGGASQPEFTSTHPSDSSRMANLQAAIPKVMPLYQQARRGK